jgi:hypothetical protein
MIRFSAASLAGIFLVAVVANAHGGNRFLQQTNVKRSATGHYEYRSLSRNVVNGEEDWLLTVHPDGSRTLRATNAYIDRTNTLRHVVLRVDARFRPIEAFVNYWGDGQWRGSALVTVNGNTLDGVFNTPNGRLVQNLAVPEKFSLIPHPISTDSWPTWYYDRKVGGSQAATLYSFDGMSTSAGGPLGRLQTQTIRFAGTERISTPAGEFDCEHFVFGDGDPELYLFGPDKLIARMVWKFADVEYVLTDYTPNE